MRTPFHLRPSEIRLLKYIAGGYQLHEAAKILGIKPGTADKHSDNIREQMNLPKIEAAATLALAMGYFHIHEVQYKFKDPAQLPFSSYPRQKK